MAVTAACRALPSFWMLPGENSQLLPGRLLLAWVSGVIDAAPPPKTETGGLRHSGTSRPGRSSGPHSRSHGWSRGTADELSLGRLRYPGVVGAACGRAKPRPVAAGQRIGGHTVRDHAEQHGERDDGDRRPGKGLA